MDKQLFLTQMSQLLGVAEAGQGPAQASDEDIRAALRSMVDSQAAREDYGRSVAEIVLPILAEASSIRDIFDPVKLTNGEQIIFDIPFEDVECVWSLPQIGAVPSIQLEGSQLMIGTDGIHGGFEYQMSLARDGRIDVAQNGNRLLLNRFARQEDAAGWSLIKAHEAALAAAGSDQIFNGYAADGTQGANEELNIYTLNEMITVADTLGEGGRRVTDIYVSPRRFGDLRNQVTSSALPEDLRASLWGNGQGNSNPAELRIHKVYNTALVPDNKAYAFTQKDGFRYGRMPIREEMKSMNNPMSILEWKVGVIAREEVGFGVLDNLGLLVATFN